MSEPLLRIRNHHTVYCGDPPIVNSDDPAVYIGYFENTYAEQWIFTFGRKTRHAELLGGGREAACFHDANVRRHPREKVHAEPCPRGLLRATKKSFSPVEATGTALAEAR